MIDLTTFKYEDLKKLNILELTELCSCLRQEIIDKVSLNGGHLSSNLGVVELVVAIHYVFDLPFDKLLFDVAHQGYAHKLLTGRKLDNLRKINGISGFLKREESNFDEFEGGHSGGAIGYGLGLLKAKELGTKIGEVISLIGDASLANGNSLESLNLLGENKTGKMIIIVNDNQMSISKNVGALANNLNKMRTGKFYNALKKVPVIKTIAKPLAKRLKNRYYENQFFRSLGFNYIENVDGHNLDDLIKYLTYAKNSPNSIVIHVKTQKGKGYSYSELDQTGKWHSVKPFDKETGLIKACGSCGEKITEYLVKEMANNEKIIVITPAMSYGCGIDKIKELYPNRFIDTGIAEASAIYYAASLSQNAFIPIIITYANFISRGFDEILNELARTNSNVTILLDHAGIVAGDGNTHQGIYDEAFFNSLPNTHVYNPDCKHNLISYLDEAIHNLGINVIRYPHDLPNELVNEDDLKFLINKNHPNLIITKGLLSSEIYEYLLKNDFEYDLLSFNYNNFNAINHLLLNKKYQRIITIEEINKAGSIVNYLDKRIESKIISYHLNKEFINEGSRLDILKKYHLDIEGILNGGEKID